MSFKAIFCLAVLILSAANADSTPSNPFTIIDIRTNPTFVMKVESKDSSPENPKYIESNMLISIDSSESILFKTCKHYNTSKYTSYKVNPEENDKAEDQHSLAYNLLNVTDYTAEANVILNENYWSANSLTVVNQCEGVLNYTGAHGLVGLGYRDTAKKNFKGDTKSFALYMEKSKDAKTIPGNLVFNPAASDIEKHTLLNTLKANEDWHLSGPTKVTFGGISNSVDKLNVTFDMRNPGYFLPEEIVMPIVKDLWRRGLSYTLDIFRGNWTDLPNIVINVGGQEIIIKPDQYMWLPLSVQKKNYQTQEVTFILRANKRNDTIMLGWKYMYEHYTVFDMNDGNIKLYTAEDAIEKDKAEREKQTKEAEENYRKEIERRRKEKEERERKEKEEKERREKEAEEEVASARRRRIIGWTVGIIVFLIIVGVAGFFGWKKYQANKRVHDVNSSPLMYGQT